MNNSLGILCIRLWWSNVKILTAVAGVLGSNSLVGNLIFCRAEFLGRLGSNLVFIVPFGTLYVEFGSEVWLVPFGIKQYK
jgi:hypothetical protein